MMGVSKLLFFKNKAYPNSSIFLSTVPNMKTACRPHLPGTQPLPELLPVMESHCAPCVQHK